jgi:hypothetical protein
MGAAAAAPHSAIARISTAAPSATLGAGCAKSANSPCPSAAATSSTAPTTSLLVVCALGSTATAHAASSSAMLVSGDGGGSRDRGQSSVHARSRREAGGKQSCLEERARAVSSTREWATIGVGAPDAAAAAPNEGSFMGEG